MSNRTGQVRFAALVLIMLVPYLARAAEPQWPVLDVNAVPFLKEAARADYADFLLSNLPRVFAIASNGAHGWNTGGTIEEDRAGALKTCSEHGGTDCALYAEDLQVVWHGRRPGVLPETPGPLFATSEFALVPDSRFIWRGPRVARGVFVWGHGKSGQGIDLRASQPPPYVRAFNNAGFDVIRFARAPAADYSDPAADFLRQGLAHVRSLGWRTVVVGGQSRGAWNSLQMLSSPGLVDGVIAVSPASLSGGRAAQDAELHRLLRGANSSSTRVAIAQFKSDIYVADPDDRAREMQDLLRGRVNSVLMIDQPAGLTGHSAGNSGAFARQFAGCLLRFITDPVPLAQCGTTESPS
ncbi:MAG: alpha/beta hydrolase, partial [Acetobacteraceae bacterium]|nr:alpha/beta hydrolase [Acetobacteraceae bacterium]